MFFSCHCVPTGMERNGEQRDEEVKWKGQGRRDSRMRKLSGRDKEGETAG